MAKKRIVERKLYECESGHLFVMIKESTTGEPPFCLTCLTPYKELESEIVEA